MTRPAYNPLEMYRFKSSAFPFTSSATVDANVLTIESVDATDAIAAAALAGLGKGSTLTEAGGTGDQLTALGDTLSLLPISEPTRQAENSSAAFALKKKNTNKGACKSKHNNKEKIKKQKQRTSYKQLR